MKLKDSVVQCRNVLQDSVERRLQSERVGHYEDQLIATALDPRWVPLILVFQDVSCPDTLPISSEGVSLGIGRVSGISPFRKGV